MTGDHGPADAIAPVGRATRLASERMTRALALVIGAIGALLGLIVADEIPSQATHLAWWWTPLAVVAVFGPCLAVAALSFEVSLVAVRRLLVGVAIGLLATIVLVPLAVRHADLHQDALWLLTISVLGGPAAGVVWRPWVAAGVLVLTIGGASVVHGEMQGGVHWVSLLLDFSRNFGISGILTWGTITLVRAATVLDAESDRAARAAAAMAADDAKCQERERFSAIIHDEVMSALLDASRGRSAPVVARRARQTLRQFDEFRSSGVLGDTLVGEGEPGSELAADELVAVLRSTVSALGADIAFRWSGPIGRDLPRIPAQVCETLTAAAGEAVRNSVRHAGAGPVEREVVVAVGADALRIDIRDAGVGFDVEAVPPHRLGMRRSILGRMDELPGGAAFLDTAPGRGTRVALVWVPAPVAATGSARSAIGPDDAGRWELLDLLGLRGRQRLVMATGLVATVASMMVVDLRHLPDRGAGILAGYALIAAGATVTVGLRAERFPRRWAALVALTGPVATALVYHDVRAEQIDRMVWTAYAASLVLSFLAVRGRGGTALVGFALLVGVVAVLGLGLLSAQSLALVVAGILIAAVLRANLRTLRRLADDSAARAVARAFLRAQGQERARQLDRLDERAWPMLARIADGDELTGPERHESRLLEAELRDGLRAPALTTTELVAATRAARGRGVEVLLLDDGGLVQAPGDLASTVAERARQQLDEADSGAVTVRVLPPGRETVATIVVDGDTGMCRIEIDRDGSTHTLGDHG